MTAFTTLTSGSLAVGKPLTSTIALALRDNPLAIAEGDASAPRLYGKAAARLGNGLLTLTIAAADTYFVNFGLGSVVGTLVTTSTVDVAAHTWTMTHYTGSTRCRASHSCALGHTSSVTLFKNGTLVSTFATTSATAVARTVDVSFVAGDVLEWRHKTSNAAGASTVSVVNQSASDAYVEQPLLIPASAI